MSDPREAAVAAALKRLQEAATEWRQLRGARERSEALHGGWTEVMEHRLQGLDGALRKGILEVKLALADLEEAFDLFARRETSGQLKSENLNSRRKFLETAHRSLARLEAEVVLKSRRRRSKVNNGFAETFPVQQSGPPPPADEEPLQEPRSESKLRKSVSFHEHARSSDGEVRVVFAKEVGEFCPAADAAADKPRLFHRFLATVLKYRMMLSLSLAVALFLLLLMMVSVTTSKRLLMRATPPPALATAAAGPA